MDLTFSDEHLLRLYTDPGFRDPKLGPDLVRATRKALGRVRTAQLPADLRSGGTRLEKLRGDRRGLWSIRVNSQHRLIMRFAADVATILELVDYH